MRHAVDHEQRFAAAQRFTGAGHFLAAGRIGRREVADHLRDIETERQLLLQLFARDHRDGVRQRGGRTIDARGLDGDAVQFGDIVAVGFGFSRLEGGQWRQQGGEQGVSDDWTDGRAGLRSAAEFHGFAPCFVGVGGPDPGKPHIFGEHNKTVYQMQTILI